MATDKNEVRAIALRARQAGRDTDGLVATILSRAAREAFKDRLSEASGSAEAMFEVLDLVASDSTWGWVLEELVERTGA